jgi:phage terminase Nu1 subunit (DNA packaging protein)
LADAHNNKIRKFQTNGIPVSEQHQLVKFLQENIRLINKSNQIQNDDKNQHISNQIATNTLPPPDHQQCVYKENKSIVLKELVHV